MSKTLSLSVKLDVVASQKLSEELLELRGSDLVLDAKETTQLGTHGIQTILVAAHSWKADGKSLKLENVSEEAAAQIATLGLEQHMLESPGSSQ
jgi:anti-anti-sigma regulatory factor